MEDNTSAKFEFLASFILPNGILDWFDFVKANEEWKTRARVTPRAEEALTPDNFYN